MTKVIIIHDCFLPSKTANVVQTIKMVEALAKISEVELWVPSVKTKQANSEELRLDYCTQRDITFRRLPSFLVQSKSTFISAVGSYLFKITFYAACIWLLWQEKDPVIVYSREPEAIVIARLVSFLRNSTLPSVFEIHELPTHPYERILSALACRLATKMVVISYGLRDRFPQFQKKMSVLPLSVDQSWLTLASGSKIGIKEEFKLKPEIGVVFYAGSDLQWKGVTTLIRTAKKDKKKNRRYVFVGFKRTGSIPQNCLFIPRVSREKLKKLYLMADCFILPNTGKSETSRFYTSPIKLFEYLAMKRPVIAADLPSIREIVTEDQVWFFEPDEPQSLLRMINRVLRLPKDEREKKVRAAYALAKRYTWEKRAQNILQLIHHET